MKFQSNSFNSVQLTERTKNCNKLCYKGNILKNKYARVIVLVHDTLSHCAIEVYEVLTVFNLRVVKMSLFILQGE